MNQEEYNALEGINYSSLKWILKSTLDFVHNSNKVFVPTDSMIFGTICDNLALDRGRMNEDFMILDESKRPNQDISSSTGKPYTMAAKDNKEWLEELKEKAGIEGKTLVKASVIDNADILINSVKESKTIESAKARELLWTLPGENQKVITWTDEETGIKCKGRVDRSLTGQTVDMKVFVKYSREQFPRAAAEYNLDLQGVMYMEGEKTDFFRWVVIQPVPPHNVCVYRMARGSREWECGYRKYRYCLNKLKEYQETGLIPGAGSDGLLGEYDFSLPIYHINQWI